MSSTGGGWEGKWKELGPSSREFPTNNRHQSNQMRSSKVDLDWVTIELWRNQCWLLNVFLVQCSSWYHYRFSWSSGGGYQLIFSGEVIMQPETIIWLLPPHCLAMRVGKIFFTQVTKNTWGRFDFFILKPTKDESDKEFAKHVWSSGMILSHHLRAYHFS